MLRAALAFVLCLALVPGCKKYEGPEPEKKEPPQAAQESPAAKKPEPPPEPKRELTSAEKGQQLFAKLAKGVDNCLGNYMQKMKMEKLEDGFLPIDLNRMDKACRAPIEAYKRGGHGLLSKFPELDAAALHMASFADAYLRMSFRFKQLGSPDRWKVIERIEENRSKALSSAAALLQQAAAVAHEEWPKGRQPDETVVPEDLEATVYRGRAAQFAMWLGDNLSRLVADYRTYGFQPAEIQESIYYFQFRYAYYTTVRAYELTRKRFQALRCNGGKDCERLQKSMSPIVEAADAVVASYEKGLRFYKGDYFKRLDDAVKIEKEMGKQLKALRKAIKKARL